MVLARVYGYGARGAAASGRACVWIAGVAATLLGACGGPMLPSDFTGQPAGRVNGTVQRAPGIAAAARPHLSLEWLRRVGTTTPAPGALIGQMASYERSPDVTTDWNIDLDAPVDAARFNAVLGGRQARLATAKLVYFDDRLPDGRLDWGCTGDSCDRVSAVSREFVVFVETPPACARSARPLLPPGYHYFSYDQQTGAVHQLATSEALIFMLGDRTPASSDPTKALNSFADALVRSWAVDITGC